MRNLLITSLLICTNLVCIGQKKDSDKVYWTALEVYTHYLDTAYHDKGVPHIPPVTKRAIYFQRQDYIDSIPQRVNGYPIILLTSENYKKIYKDHKGSLTQTVMFPVRVKDNMLEVTITPYIGKFKGSHLNLGVSNGVTVIFEFDCAQNKFIVSQVRVWGI
jgi:hypothetical protein